MIRRYIPNFISSLNFNPYPKSTLVPNTLTSSLLFHPHPFDSGIKIEKLLTELGPPSGPQYSIQTRTNIAMSHKDSKAGSSKTQSKSKKTWTRQLSDDSFVCPQSLTYLDNVSQSSTPGMAKIKKDKPQKTKEKQAEQEVKKVSWNRSRDSLSSNQSFTSLGNNNPLQHPTPSQSLLANPGNLPETRHVLLTPIPQGPSVLDSASSTHITNEADFLKELNLAKTTPIFDETEGFEEDHFVQGLEFINAELDEEAHQSILPTLTIEDSKKSKAGKPKTDDKSENTTRQKRKTIGNNQKHQLQEIKEHVVSEQKASESQIITAKPVYHKVAGSIGDVLEKLSITFPGNKLIDFINLNLKRIPDQVSGPVLDQFQDGMVRGQDDTKYLTGYCTGYLAALSDNKDTLVTDMVKKLTQLADKMTTSTEQCVRTNSETVNNALTLQKGVNICISKLEKTTLESQNQTGKLQELMRKSFNNVHLAASHTTPKDNKKLTKISESTRSKEARQGTSTEKQNLKPPKRMKCKIANIILHISFSADVSVSPHTFRLDADDQDLDALDEVDHSNIKKLMYVIPTKLIIFYGLDIKNMIDDMWSASTGEHMRLNEQQIIAKYYEAAKTVQSQAEWDSFRVQC